MEKLKENQFIPVGEKVKVGLKTFVTIKKGFIRSNELEYIKRKLDYKDIMISAKDNGILTLIMIG